MTISPVTTRIGIIVGLLLIMAVPVVIYFTYINPLNKSSSSSDSNPTTSSTKTQVKATGSFTTYQSYPKCCPSSPNYDPTASTTECGDYSGCKYIGMLAGYVTTANPDGYKSINFVETNNLVAFYDNSDKTGSNWFKTYALRTIGVKKTINGIVYHFNATIADTCGNSDCNNCCSKNAGSNGYLVDMEYYTVLRNFGTIDAASGDLSFVIY